MKLLLGWLFIIFVAYPIIFAGMDSIFLGKTTTYLQELKSVLIGTGGTIAALTIGFGIWYIIDEIKGKTKK